MKKLFSLFLLMSVFVSSTSVLAVADNNNLDGQNSSSQEQMQDQAGQEGAGQDQAAQAEKLQKDLQLFMSFQTAAFDQDEANFEQEQQDFDQEQEDSSYKLKNNAQLNSNLTILDKVKKMAKIVAATGAIIGFAAGATYLAYKAGDKNGLNKEIKSLVEFVQKTKVLKNLVLCGIVGSAICTAIAGYIAYKYGQDFLQAHALAIIIMAQMRQAK